MKLTINHFLYLRRVSQFVKHEHILAPFTTFKRSMSFGNEHFQEHEICIKTCGNLYRRWREEKKFSNVPNGDLEFKVKYIDINQNPVLKSRNSVPVIVAIHGAPGSYRDFSGLVSHLQQKARIIVPNFPGK
ncbi:uncharacterized protein CEXT_146721 [Caerostris extrusa]|uniref:Uncharacterized protein n=1 Tax=Caerostris extrusa TaxID=172846 RepID=A0AAV4VWC4_CAEEX|nr:uncharacterized protein CEXT_146721 [Caerostris extrusa]